VEGGARCHVDYIAFVIDIREVAVGHEESDAQQNYRDQQREIRCLPGPCGSAGLAGLSVCTVDREMARQHAAIPYPQSNDHSQVVSQRLAPIELRFHICPCDGVSTDGLRYQVKGTVLALLVQLAHVFAEHSDAEQRRSADNADKYRQ